MFHKAVLHLTFCLIIGVNVVFSAPNATTLASPTNGSEFGAQKVSVGNYYYYLCSPNPCQVYFFLRNYSICIILKIYLFITRTEGIVLLMVIVLVAAVSMDFLDLTVKHVKIYVH